MSVTLGASLRRLWYGLRYSLGDPGSNVLLFAVVFQSGHMFEHVAQLFQHLVLDYPLKDAHGVLGAADIETVHFLANALVILTLGFVYYAWEFHRPEAAVRQFRALRILMISALVIQGYHVVEHAAKYYQHIETGRQGTPGFIGYLLKSNLVYFHFGINAVVYPLMVALLALYVWNMQLYPALLQARARVRIREYLKIAKGDGKLSDDERMILARIRYETDMRSREILERLQAGARSDELRTRLREMERALIESATAQALVDGKITQEERALIEALARNNPIKDALGTLAKLHGKDHVPDEPRDGEGGVPA